MHVGFHCNLNVRYILHLKLQMIVYFKFYLFFYSLDFA